MYAYVSTKKLVFTRRFFFLFFFVINKTIYRKELDVKILLFSVDVCGFGRCWRHQLCFDTHKQKKKKMYVTRERGAHTNRRKQPPN
jgi:hypothetical protein